MLSHFIFWFISSAMAALNPALPRGSEIVKIQPKNSSLPAEVCIIPKKYPGAIYNDKDLRNEQELCSLGGFEAVALCPKTVSTNPAVEFYSLPEGLTSAQVEARSCNMEESKKLAKYKSSISCSYTPSLLSYYHISRILGNILQVPSVVIRTMNLATHKTFPPRALKIVKEGLLREIWKGVASHLKAGSASSKREDLFTSDMKQTYGALQQNPRNEEKYSEMFFSARGEETRADAFRSRSPIYSLLKDSSSLRSLVGNQFTTSNVQKVLQMQNVADMVVMDTLLNQQDRFGNVHFTNVFYYVDTANGQKVVRKNKMTEEERRTKGALMVKHMMLKDNDCGIVKTNAAKKARLLEGLSHMNPETYHRLLKLHAEVSKESTRRFFKDETLMTDEDYTTFTKNLREAVATLKSACQKGRLKLDLDLDAHFTNKPVNQSCE